MEHLSVDIEIPSKNLNNKRLKNGLIDFAAGTVGGVANVYAGQPLDTVKVKMQTFPSLYPNLRSCIHHTFHSQGIRGLYAGTYPAIAASVAENAVLFAAYGFCQNFIHSLCGPQSNSALDVTEDAVAGSMAAGAAALVLCPTELVKCRLQAQKEMGAISLGTMGTIRGMWKTGGFRIFLTGLGPTVMREVPGYFFFFGTYEFVRHLFANGGDKDKIGIAKTAVAGGVAGVAFWTSVFPTDVIKSRIQTQSSGKTFLPTLREIIHTNGIRGLYKGLTPTVIRAMLASAALLITYESTKSALTARL